MRRALRWAGITLGLGVLALVTLAPREPVEMGATFEPRKFGEGVDVYLEVMESRFDDIRDGAQKRIVWAGPSEMRTPLSIVYVHGFSASSEEIRPVPDRVAEALGANLFFTRLSGHGRGAEAMGEPRVGDWMQDMAEALAVGRAIGDEVIVIGTSTGATLAHAALFDAAMAEKIRGVVLISPNYGINNPMAPLLTWPGARQWLPLVAGARRSFEPQNEGHAKFWTTEYPSTAVFPMAALVAHVRGMDHANLSVPALFYYDDGDQVVRPDLTDGVVAHWGGAATRGRPVLTETDDRFAHVVAGDILSPGNTGRAVEEIVAWVNKLE
ncbi:lysophospholipase [Roseovarius nubinhibens]|uniref:alpha/beta hydrolase n=1 Tax=Roseovarius nubinhibens TaxID=314263 RepID=UPI001C090FBB|nr:alpha/beta fold hydrolase [Roseovarius nubinhibens]MBU3000681.1 lysophospholipase [Roseovarius nubinhibens]